MSTEVGIIISTILTITFGIPTYVSMKNLRRSKIFFFYKDKLKLYEDIVKNMPDLTISYKGESIKKNMFFLKGIFIFSGKKDASPSDIQKGINLKINNEDSVWLNSTILGRTDNLDIRLSQSKTSLNIEFDLLKDKDFFILEALGESDEIKFNFSHRIADVNKRIETGRIGLFKNVRSVFISYLGILFSLFFLFWMMTKTFEIHSSDLEPNYYNSVGNHVSESEVIANAANDTIFNLLVNDTSIYSTQNDLSNQIKEIKRKLSESKVNERILSIADSASNDYSTLGLLLRETKSYDVGQNYSVRFKHKYDLFIFVIYLFVFLIGAVAIMLISELLISSDKIKDLFAK